eukprot:CAMPEP_0179077320 /NCGR_PEP_ID=MMETSP0796-20121207/34554_1 /TAXON_ID=73915 /ORGANISM="Pyrodinium bahamense, Strain pbaha01" /LENGTH=245 /DNA_ID=CAMNT_0020774597 /DNA_START=29 /DNA_END=766 /DNA_ORIENTATION=+
MAGAMTATLPCGIFLAGQAGMKEEDLTQWEYIHAIEKDGLFHVLAPGSAPGWDIACCTRSGSKGTSVSSASDIGMPDHILFASDSEDDNQHKEQGAHPGDGSEEGETENEDGAAEACDNLDPGTEGVSKPRRRRDRRPCKSARLRYQAVVNRIQNMILADPYSFDFDALTLPKQVNTNEKLKRKLATRMHNFREEELMRRGEGAECVECTNSDGHSNAPASSNEPSPPPCAPSRDAQVHHGVGMY